MLLIESSAREASNMPADIANMPEQYLTIQVRHTSMHAHTRESISQHNQHTQSP
jgi:hypothetical protein